MTRPSRITSTRSASPSTSGTSLETSSTPTPLGQAANHLVQLGSRADVDAPGRLVEDEQPGAAQQPPSDDYLLLVAAGQRAHGAAHVARPQFQLVRDPRGRGLLLAAVVNPALASSAKVVSVMLR